MKSNDAAEGRDSEKTLMKSMTKLVTKCIEISKDALHYNVVFSSLHFDYAWNLAIAVDEKVFSDVVPLLSRLISLLSSRVI